MHAYEFSITAKTATTAARTLKKMQERTVLRGNRQSTQKCTNERKSYTAPASQAYSAAPCRVAIVHHRFLACTLSIRQRLPRKTRNVPPAIPYVLTPYRTSTRTSTRTLAVLWRAPPDPLLLPYEYVLWRAPPLPRPLQPCFGEHPQAPFSRRALETRPGRPPAAVLSRPPAAVLWRAPPQVRGPHPLQPSCSGEHPQAPYSRVLESAPRPPAAVLWRAPPDPLQTPCSRRALESTPRPPAAVFWRAPPDPLQPCSGEHPQTPCSRALEGTPSGQAPSCRALESTPSPPAAVLWRAPPGHPRPPAAVVLWRAPPDPLLPCSGEHPLINPPCRKPSPNIHLKPDLFIDVFGRISLASLVPIATDLLNSGLRTLRHK